MHLGESVKLKETVRLLRACSQGRCLVGFNSHELLYLRTLSQLLDQSALLFASTAGLSTEIEDYADHADVRRI